MASTASAEPQRRCVGCGRSAAKGALLRLVAAGGWAVPDPAGRGGGRGAYVCRASSSKVDAACLERAIRRGSVARALRRPVKIAPDLLLAGRPDEASKGHRAPDRNRLESIG